MAAWIRPESGSGRCQLADMLDALPAASRSRQCWGLLTGGATCLSGLPASHLP